MIVAIVAIVLALIAAYFAFTYRQQVQDWEAAASETLSKLQAAGLELQETVVTGVADYEDKISDLSSQLEQAQTEAGVAQSGQAATEQELADTQAELEATQQDLEDTQAALDDANAKLAELGELVLPNGTYFGPVLAARVDPLPAIVFQGEEDVWRVAEVAEDVAITAGTETLTLEEFSALLQSTDPADAALANGTYEVKVKKGLVTSITQVLEG
ncbi:MAG TPA: hypothetical protein VFT27_01920 [Actinomycetota bacterium]|nr:hypothetical protein [Actinomycetota bacterium]